MVISASSHIGIGLLVVLSVKHSQAWLHTYLCELTDFSEKNGHALFRFVKNPMAPKGRDILFVIIVIYLESWSICGSYDLDMWTKEVYEVSILNVHITSNI